MGERAHEIAALPPTPAAAPLVLEHLIVRWTRDARPLALLYQEGVAGGSETGADGTALWRDFWLEAAPRFGLTETEGRLLHLLFETEALYHLSTWSPALEAGALREICGHLGAVWLGAGPAPSRGALAHAERTAGVINAGDIAPAAAKIAEAAATVIEERGVGGLTHRAVAAQAGVTAGAVTHHFRTIQDLVAGAIRGQVLSLAKRTSAALGPAASPLEGIITVEEFAGTIRALVVDGRAGVRRIDRRGLFLAAIRRPEMASSGAVIRFAHGATTRGALLQMFKIEDPALTLHAGLLSRMLSTVALCCVNGTMSRETGALLVDEIIGRLASAAERR